MCKKAVSRSRQCVEQSLCAWAWCQVLFQRTGEQADKIDGPPWQPLSLSFSPPGDFLFLSPNSCAALSNNAPELPTFTFPSFNGLISTPNVFDHRLKFGCSSSAEQTQAQHQRVDSLCPEIIRKSSFFSWAFNLCRKIENTRRRAWRRAKRQSKQ